jgi:hypothetical protein
MLAIAAVPLLLLLHGHYHNNSCSQNRSQLSLFKLSYEIDGFIEPLPFTANFSSDVCHYEAIVPFGVPTLKVYVLPWSIFEWDTEQFATLEVNGGGIDCNMLTELCEVADESAYFDVISVVTKIWIHKPGVKADYFSNYTVALKREMPNNSTCVRNSAVQLENLSVALEVNGEPWPSQLKPAFRPGHCEYTIQVPDVLATAHFINFHPKLIDPTAKIEFVHGKHMVPLDDDEDYHYHWDWNRGAPFDMRFLIIPGNASGLPVDQHAHYHIRAFQSSVDTDPVVSKLLIRANGLNLVLDPPLRGDSSDPREYSATCAVPILSAPKSIFIQITTQWPKTTQIYLNAEQSQLSPRSGEFIPLNLTISTDFAAATIEITTLNSMCPTCAARRYRVTVKWLFPMQPMAYLALFASDAAGPNNAGNSDPAGENRLTALAVPLAAPEEAAEGKGWASSASDYLFGGGGSGGDGGFGANGIAGQPDVGGMVGVSEMDASGVGMSWYGQALYEQARQSSPQTLLTMHARSTGNMRGSTDSAEPGEHTTSPLVLNPPFQPNTNMSTTPAFRGFTASTTVPTDAAHVVVVASVLKSLKPQQVRGVQIRMVNPPIGPIDSGARTLVPLDLNNNYLPNKIQLELSFTLCNDCSVLRYEVDVLRRAPLPPTKKPPSKWHSPITVGLVALGGLAGLSALAGMVFIRRRRSRSDAWEKQGENDPVLTGAFSKDTNYRRLSGTTAPSPKLQAAGRKFAAAKQSPRVLKHTKSGGDLLASLRREDQQRNGGGGGLRFDRSRSLSRSEHTKGGPIAAIAGFLGKRPQSHSAQNFGVDSWDGGGGHGEGSSSKQDLNESIGEWMIDFDMIDLLEKVGCGASGQVFRGGSGSHALSCTLMHAPCSTLFSAHSVTYAASLTAYPSLIHPPPTTAAPPRAPLQVCSTATK